MAILYTGRGARNLTEASCAKVTEILVADRKIPGLSKLIFGTSLGHARHLLMVWHIWNITLPPNLLYSSSRHSCHIAPLLMQGFGIVTGVWWINAPSS
ncbi:unnamed protein product [Ixodes pacificus]